MTTEKILVSQLRNVVDTAIRNIYKSNGVKGNIVIDGDVNHEIEEMINRISLDLKYELQTLLEERQPVIDVINASSIEEFQYWKKYHLKMEPSVCILEQNNKSGNEKKLCEHILLLIKGENEFMDLFRNRIPSVMFVFRMRSKDIVEVSLVDCPKIGDKDSTHILIYENEFGSFEDEEVLNELKEFLKTELNELEDLLENEKVLQNFYIDNIEKRIITMIHINEQIDYIDVYQRLKIYKIRSLKGFLGKIDDKEDLLSKCKNLFVSKKKVTDANLRQDYTIFPIFNEARSNPPSEIHIIREKC